MDTFVIVIQGVDVTEYERIKKDLLYQMGGKPECLFCLLPGEYPEVSIVWISKDLELKEKEYYNRVLERYFHVSNLDEPLYTEKINKVLAGGL